MEEQTHQMEALPQTRLSKLIAFSTAAVPYAVTALAFVLLCHIVHLQTRVEQVASTGIVDSAARWLFMVAPAALAAGLAAQWQLTLTRRLAAGAAALLVTCGLAAAGPSILTVLMLIPIGLLGWCTFSSIKTRTLFRSDLIAGSLLCFIIAYAASQRQEMLFKLINTQPDPDFFGYLQFAQQNSGYNTKYREPFYVWFIQLLGLFGGTIDQTLLRLASALSALGAVAATYGFARKHLNLATAVIAASLYAGASFMIYTSARGLREDLIILTIILFLWINWNLLRQRLTWGSLTLLGFVGAAASLMRLSSLSYVVMLMAGSAAWLAYKNRAAWAQQLKWLIPIVITIALTTPYFVQCKREYGDPFFAVKYHVRFYANEEFAGKRPDFPTREEIAKDAYAGPAISAGTYIFKYHSLSEIFNRTWDGFVKIFFGKNFKIGFLPISEAALGYALVMILHLVGIALLFLPRHWYLLIAILLCHAPLFFLAASPTFDPRLLTTAMVFTYITVGMGLGLGGQMLLNFLRNKEPNTPQYGRQKSHLRPPHKSKQPKKASHK